MAKSKGGIQEINKMLEDNVLLHRIMCMISYYTPDDIFRLENLIKDWYPASTTYDIKHKYMPAILNYLRKNPDCDPLYNVRTVLENDSRLHEYVTTHCNNNTDDSTKRASIQRIRDYSIFRMIVGIELPLLSIRITPAKRLLAEYLFKRWVEHNEKGFEYPTPKPGWFDTKPVDAITEYYSDRAKEIDIKVDELVSKPLTTTEEKTMIKVETITFVNDKQIKRMTDDEIFAILKEAEDQITNLESLKNKPKKIKDKIIELQSGIDAMVAHLDGATETATTE